jgi:hypothetical protein
LWSLYAECIAYCDEYEKFSEEIQVAMSLEDYIDIKSRKELRDQTKTSLKGTRKKSKGA